MLTGIVARRIEYGRTSEITVNPFNKNAYVLMGDFTNVGESFYSGFAQYTEEHGPWVSAILEGLHVDCTSMLLHGAEFLIDDLNKVPNFVAIHSVLRLASHGLYCSCSCVNALEIY